MNIKLNQGTTIITLLILMVVIITVTSAAVVLAISNTQATNRMEQGIIAHQLAESAMEDALLRLLRNPNYTGGTLLTTDDGSGIATISGSLTKIATAEGTVGAFKRKVQVEIDYSENTMTVLSWKEIF